MAIEQDSLIFIGRVDFAPCDGEIDDRSLSIGSRKFDSEACAAKKPSATNSSKKVSSWPQAKSKSHQMTHKLNSSHEWLLEKAKHWNADALYKALRGLAYWLAGQSIHDLFHSEMDSDGYFDKKTKPNADPFHADSWGSQRWHT